MLHRAGAQVHQAGQAEQGDRGREQRKEPVIGQAGRGQGAPVSGELPGGALGRVAPARLADVQWSPGAAGHFALRRDRFLTAALGPAVQISRVRGFHDQSPRPDNPGWAAPPRPVDAGKARVHRAGGTVSVPVRERRSRRRARRSAPCGSARHRLCHGYARRAEAGQRRGPRCASAQLTPGQARTAVPVLKRHLRWPPVTRRSRPACREDGTPSPFPAAWREHDEFGERVASDSAAVMLGVPWWAARRGTGRRRGGARHRRRGARNRGRRGRVRRRRGC